MAVVYLPLEDRVVRFVRGRQLRRDEDDNVLGVLPTAFERRESEETLSVTWLEHFPGDYEQQLTHATEAIGRQLRVKPRDGFAVARVGTLHEKCATLDVRIRVVHDPEEENTGHSVVRGLPRDNLKLLELLAGEACLDVRPAR